MYLTEPARPAAIPAITSGPLSSSGASRSGASCTAPATGARRWWPLMRKAAKAIRKASPMMSLRPSPGCVSIITPASSTIAPATSVAGPTLYGRPTHQAASSAIASQKRLISGESQSLLKRTIAAPWISSVLCG